MIKTIQKLNINDLLDKITLLEAKQRVEEVKEIICRNSADSLD